MIRGEGMYYETNEIVYTLVYRYRCTMRAICEFVHVRDSWSQWIPRTWSVAHYLPTRPFTPPYMRHVDLPGYQHFDLRRFRESGPRFIYLGEKFAQAVGMVYHPRAAALHGIVSRCSGIDRYTRCFVSLYQTWIAYSLKILNIKIKFF